jgi:hypothetical protein
MPPRTRSSLSSLPATPSARSINSTSTTPRTTPRKPPRCSKCGNPKAGHPRTGCPYEEAESPIRAKQEPDISDELSSLNIETPASNVDDKAVLRSRRVKLSAAPEASLASLSSTSSDIVNRLLKPGIMSNDRVVEDAETVKEWAKNIVISTNPSGTSRPREYMPCTLETPNSSFLSSREGTIIVADDIKPSPHNSNGSIPSALSRTWSTEARVSFLDELSKASTGPPATAFHFDSSSISGLEEDAKRLGFYTRAIRGADGLGVHLLLGRDKEGVDALFRDMTQKETVGGEATVANNGQGRVFAGGVVVGAVATFSGLAFS